LKAAFVVQRYGPEVNGGAEVLCRRVAERMASSWNIDVLTTCALDYVTWADHWEPGVETLGGVTVRRFRVDHPRCPDLFDALSAAAFGARGGPEIEERWMLEQGPHSSALLDHLDEHRDEYDLFAFFTYLYSPTFHGLPKVAERALLVPTAHDEPPFHLGIFRALFRAARALLFNTPEERDLVLGAFGPSIPHEVVGLGVDDPGPVEPELFRRRYAERVRGRYVLYAGRIDRMKGCDELFDHFVRYRRDDPGRDLQLVLLGNAVLEPPDHPDVVALGFVPDDEKIAAMAGAEAVVVPSRYESLSLACLESWSVGVPVLVNRDSPVLAGQCARSGGGLGYGDYRTFRSALNELLDDPARRGELGAHGRRFVRERYDWRRIEDAWLRWGERVARGRAGVA